MTPTDKCPHGKNPHDCDVACCPGIIDHIDNKAPREFWLLEAKNRNRGVRYYARLKDGDELLRPNLNSSWLIRNVIEVIEKSAYDKLQSRLDKAENLLRDGLYALKEGDQYNRFAIEEKIQKYFSEVEK